MNDEVLEIDFRPEPRAGADVRRGVATFLTDRDFPHGLLDDVLLVVSELVTNAVVHAGTEGRFELRWDGRRVTVAVTDGDRRPPMIPVSAPAVGGRGLFLVERLSTEWGSDVAPPGKTVWATLEVHR